MARRIHALDAGLAVRAWRRTQGCPFCSEPPSLVSFILWLSCPSHNKSLRFALDWLLDPSGAGKVTAALQGLGSTDDKGRSARRTCQTFGSEPTIRDLGSFLSF